MEKSTSPARRALDKSGKTLPDELIESIKRNKVG